MSGGKKEEAVQEKDQTPSWGIFVFLILVGFVVAAVVLFKTGKIDSFFNKDEETKESVPEKQNETGNQESPKPEGENPVPQQAESIKIYHLKETIYLAAGDTITVTYDGDIDVEKNIGEELICSDYKVVINEYKIKTGAIDSFYQVPEGTEWIGLIVTATNTSDDEVNINSSSFELTNSNGEILTYDVLSYKVYGNYDTLGGTLAPGGTKTGYINFSNNNTYNNNLTVKFKCGFWGSGSYIVKLK